MSGEDIKRDWEGNRGRGMNRGEEIDAIEMIAEDLNLARIRIRIKGERSDLWSSSAASSNHFWMRQ